MHACVQQNKGQLSAGGKKAKAKIDKRIYGGVIKIVTY